MVKAGFSGFSSGAQAFYAELAENNEKSWLDANRERYDGEVVEPAIAFINTLGPELAQLFPEINYNTKRNGSGSMMRINRDIRFTPDKRPYKTNLGIVFWIGEGKKVEMPCFYFNLDADGAFFYAGQHAVPKPRLDSFRREVANEDSGAELETILNRLAADGLPQYEEPSYKRVPSGYPDDHPRADLLRHTGLGVIRRLVPQELSGSGLIDICAEHARRSQPLIEWLVAANEG